MKSTLLKSLKEFVSRNKLIARGDALVVSVSGGIDSMTMLRLMHSIVADWQLHLTVAHFNHRLRGSESDSDETLVRSACKEYGFECSVSSADTHALVKEQKRSLQEIARDLRYSFLIEVCRTVGAATIATAHNADDNIETLLFNLFRGAGVHGLSGIPVSRDHDGFRLVRPLLFASRNRIHEFAEENKVTFREDSSNLKDDYSRNYIRHHIIPAIREHINGGVSETLGRASALFHELDEYLSSNVAGLSPSVIVSESADEIIINRTRLLELPQLLQESFFISILKKQGVVEAQSALIESMISIAHSETGASIDIHNGHAFTRDRERLVLYRNQTNQSFSHIIMPEKSFDFGAFNFTSSLVPATSFSPDPYTECIDYDKLGKSLLLRSWQDGDRMIPIGMTDFKKLSDLFIEAKVALYDKSHIPILTSDNEIVWVCGIRLDNRFKITQQTKKILKLEYRPRKKI